MSTRNSQKHFTVGLGQFTPWRSVNPRVKAVQTATASGGKFQYKTGLCWEGKWVELPKAKDNRRVRVRGRDGWLQPRPMKDVSYYGADKGWKLIAF